MDKEKIMIVLLAVVLLIGLVMTSQSRWTVDEKEGVPLEQITQQGGQTQPTDGVENPHEGMMGAAEDVELNEEGFPKELLGLELVEFLSGEEAIRGIEELHGATIDIVDGQVATYGGGDREIEIWVSEAESPAATAEQIEVMTEMIIHSDGPYTAPNIFQIRGIEMHQTQGMGMTNYYYQQGTKAYWIGIRGLEPAPVLGLVMNLL